MALNPPIQAIPVQETDRNEHLQRFLTSLPNFGSGSGGLVAHGARTKTTNLEDREMEVAQRRLERKTRRREQAGILKSRPPTPPRPNTEPRIHDSSEEGKRTRDLATDQEWWDNYRAQKQALAGPSTSRLSVDVNAHNITEKETDVEREMDRQYARQERRQKRIPKGKGRTSERGIKIPGMEIIDNYRPMTTALGPRMTMKSEPGKKGMFAHGKSSNTSVIRALEGTKTINPIPTSQSTSGPSHRLTLESSTNEEKGDWRDQWRRKSSQVILRKDGGGSRIEDGNGRLPPPGYTNSTSWPSTHHSSSTRPSRHRSGEMGPPPPPRVESPYRSPCRDDWLERYSSRPPFLPAAPSRHDHRYRNEEEHWGKSHTPGYPASADQVYHPLHPTLQESYHHTEQDRDAFMATMESGTLREGENQGYPPIQPNPNHRDPYQDQDPDHDHRHIHRRHHTYPNHSPRPYPYSYPSQSYDLDPIPEPQNPQPHVSDYVLYHTYPQPRHAHSQVQNQVEAQKVYGQHINVENDVPELNGFWKPAETTPLRPPKQDFTSLNLTPTNNYIPPDNPGSALPYQFTSPHHADSKTIPLPQRQFQYHPNPLGHRDTSYERGTTLYNNNSIHAQSFPPQAYMTPQLRTNQFHQPDLVTPTPAPRPIGVFMNNLHLQPQDSSMLSDQQNVDLHSHITVQGRVDNAGWGELDVRREMNIDQAMEVDMAMGMGREIEEYGASREEWKFLWSSKKP